jgi:hypothetical protein
MSRVDITDWFWNLVDSASGSSQRLRGQLAPMSKDDIRRFQLQFVEAAGRLKDSPYRDFMDSGSSEDGIADIVNWVVSQGHDYYSEVIRSPAKLPSRLEGDEDDLYGVAASVYWDRFGEELDVY